DRFRSRHFLHASRLAERRLTRPAPLEDGLRAVFKNIDFYFQVLLRTCQMKWQVQISKKLPTKGLGNIKKKGWQKTCQNGICFAKYMSLKTTLATAAPLARKRTPTVCLPPPPLFS
ncbi:unnamed protein product, partial [Laminaria digitata]